MENINCISDMMEAIDPVEDNWPPSSQTPVEFVLRPLSQTASGQEDLAYLRSRIERFEARLAAETNPVQAEWLRKTAAECQARYQDKIGRVGGENRHIRVDAYATMPGAHSMLIAGIGHNITEALACGTRPMAVPGFVERRVNESSREIWGIYVQIRSLRETWEIAQNEAPKVDVDDDDDIDIFSLDRFGEVRGRTGRLSILDRDFVTYVEQNNPEFAEYLRNHGKYDGLTGYFVKKYYNTLLYINKANIIEIRM